MQPEEFEALLKPTLHDNRLSRAERQALRQVLAEIKPAETELDLYRQVAFRLAREAMNNSLAATDVLDWLEDVVRQLKPAQNNNENIHSEAYFSPGNKCRSRIRSLMRQANHTINICVFTITDDEISEAIAEAHNRRVNVRIISDNDKSLDTGSDIYRLEGIGVPVRHDNSPYHMHHKFAIFDDEILLSGSYNWTRSAAEKNEENIIVQNDPNLVTRFAQVFEDLWEQYA